MLDTKPTIRAQLYLTSVCVYINETLHLMFRREWFAGLQSWPDESCFTLEVTLAKGGSILCRYESRETWAAVLAALEKSDITGG